VTVQLITTTERQHGTYDNVSTARASEVLTGSVRTNYDNLSKD